MADKQMSFASANFDRYAKVTRRAVFLDQMDRILPWAELVALVQPHYPTGEVGRVRSASSVCCGFIFCSSGLI